MKNWKVGLMDEAIKEKRNLSFIEQWVITQVIICSFYLLTGILSATDN